MESGDETMLKERSVQRSKSTSKVVRRSETKVDILHPLTSLDWRECSGPPVDMLNAQSVCLKDKVYMGGGVTYNRRSDARMYIYTPTSDTWDTLDTPVYWFALTVYRSQVVLIGGMEYIYENVDGCPSNKLWTLTEEGKWQETLPRMETACSFASAVAHGDHLLVIGSDEVSVFNGHYWPQAQHLPEQLFSVKSTVINGHWYLVGGPLMPGKVYCASLDLLIASSQCDTSTHGQSSTVWKRLPNAPGESCCLTALGDRLIAVESPDIHAYSHFTQSWVQVGNIPDASDAPCVVVLPSDEFMFVMGEKAFKAALKMEPFNLENQFDMKALTLLEGAGIPLMSSLSDYIWDIQQALHITSFSDINLNTLLDSWLGQFVGIRPTWNNLLMLIRHIHLDDLAQQIETYLSRRTMEQKLEEEKYATLGSEEMKVKLHLQEESIYRLKQEMASLKEERDHTILKLEEQVEELMSENKQLRGYLSIKEAEEKPLDPVPVKTGPKEEVVIETKAEQTSAQSTAVWDLRGVEVCGEMTVVIHSSHAQQIEWKGVGLKLTIHEGTLPVNVQQCVITIKASLAGQYEFPENSHLVSAVFWLRCEPMCKFTKPVTVEIQHCARSENVANLDLKFVRAVCSQKELPYTFKQLRGNFTSHSSYGVIELNSFSGLAITQEGSEDREYCSQLFYFGQPSLCTIHFVVTWNLEAHITILLLLPYFIGKDRHIHRHYSAIQCRVVKFPACVQSIRLRKPLIFITEQQNRVTAYHIENDKPVVKEEYQRKEAVLGLYQPLEFEGECISLDIPMPDGISIRGWKITPLMRPVVTKKQVDKFKEGKLTPCCQLLAEVVRKRKEIPALRHKVCLKGAKYPNDVFMISLPAKDTSSQGKRSRSPTFGDLAAASEPGPPPTKKCRFEADKAANGIPHRLAASTSGQKNVPVKPTLQDLLKELYSTASEWENIGVLLGIDSSMLDTIKATENSKSQSCLREMLKVWLKRVDPPPTWSAIAEAVEFLGNEHLANQLRAKS